MVPSECLDAENWEIFWQSNMRVIWKGGVTYRYVQAAPLYLSRAKKNLNASLSFGQAALKSCFPKATCCLS